MKKKYKTKEYDASASPIIGIYDSNNERYLGVEILW